MLCKKQPLGLENVEKLIRLLSHSQQQQQEGQLSSSEQRSSMEIEMDCRAVADVAVTKFKRVISLLGRTRTGHARFRRAPLGSPTNQISDHQPKEVSETKVYCPTPIQQVPHHHLHHIQPQHDHVMVMKNVVIERKDLASKTINFSYSPAISGLNSFMSSLTGDTDSKQPSSSSAFQVTNLSRVSSGVRPTLSSSSLKRKCNSSENGVSGKCSGSSGRCHCSKRRKLRLKRVVKVPAISMKMADIPPDNYSWRKYGQTH
ncbi:hypothetical protein F0562_003590 [Nyssa sinensis]|uniref:Zn-cluster domain-containing protein n=1 Tax=Nyssa sinensis TaxID=561372 RepID=A0A5J5BWV5_9ASTE|nr:hypothetical protein F0562_003590 [Nyssa sinensis]